MGKGIRFGRRGVVAGRERRLGKRCAAVTVRRFGGGAVPYRWLALLATLLCLAISTPAAAATLVGEWALDEGAGQIAHDRARSGLDGRLGIAAGADGADPAWVPGIAGWALRFDGADAVVLPGSVALEPATVTIEAWVRRQGTPGAYTYVVSKGSRGCDFSSYGLYTGSGAGLAFYVSDGNSYVVSPAAAPGHIWDASWHHVAGTFDGHSVRLYLDGSEVGDGSPDDRPIGYRLQSRAPYIGTYSGSCQRGYTGDIDDVRIWNSALTATQIAASRPTQPPAAGPLPARPIPAVSGRPPATVARCLVSVNRTALRAGRRNRLLVTIRRDTRRLPHVRVLLSGRNLRLVRRTNRNGRVRFVVRPRRSQHQLRIRTLGSASSCAAARIPVRP